MISSCFVTDSPQSDPKGQGVSSDSCACVCVSHSVMSDSLQPHDLQPTRLLCQSDFPGKNTGMGCYFQLQGICLTQGSGRFSTADTPGKPLCQVWLVPIECAPEDMLSPLNTPGTAVCDSCQLGDGQFSQDRLSCAARGSRA